MPLYEYVCTKCDNRFERIQKFSDPLVTECPLCGGKVERAMSIPAIHFKGSGWYVTDYASKSSTGKSTARDDEKGSTSSEAKSESKTESKSKTENKSESKSSSSESKPADKK
jgi:putative FmdB family regulatory protein